MFAFLQVGVKCTRDFFKILLSMEPKVVRFSFTTVVESIPEMFKGYIGTLKLIVQ